MVDSQLHSWRQTAKLACQPNNFIMLLLGFSAGIPLLLIFSSLSLWLKQADVARATITFFSWAGLSYAFKFIWAPLLDNIKIPILTRRLGMRRSWMLVSQISIIISIVLMALSDPKQAIMLTAVSAILLGFSSATQDIAIDAYRIESASSELQSLLSAMYIAGYRVGMITAGAGTLLLVSWLGGDNGSYIPQAWTFAYLSMAGAMLVGVFASFIAREPESRRENNSAFSNSADVLRFLCCFALCVTTFVLCFNQFSHVVGTLNIWLSVYVSLTDTVSGFITNTIRLFGAITGAFLTARMLFLVNAVPKDMVIHGYVKPVTSFFYSYGKAATIILLFIGLYRISDIVMGVIANIFYSDMGFDLKEIATYSKSYGLVATIAGGLLGGVISIRYGVFKALLIGAVLSALTNILFALMVGLDKNNMILMAVISADNLSAGLAMASFVAYLSSLTNISFTAMQYAIFSSIMTLVPKIIAGYSGVISVTLGYEMFFYITALMGVPAIVLVIVLQKTVPVNAGKVARK